MAKEKFPVIDGLRGVAALVVLIFHVQLISGVGPAIFPSGFLAVDIFFILSGFVIAHAYEKKLQGEMSFGKFAEIRALRLYPLYLAGLFLAVAIPATTAILRNEMWKAQRYSLLCSICSSNAALSIT